MVENYGKACKEVLIVLENTPEELSARIPRKFLRLLQEAADKEYEFRIDPTKGLKEQNLLPETDDILAVMRRDFLSDL